ncbi:MAG: MotA/TolQ/ExbB proton channel family protein [Actinomycetota bacterium]|nr:MotA/TolQ/ExbB proton channel family protein [Actinomycetota bacterium]MDZ4180889.1 MotA/TolQ/ExbB proton channel family protein [Coriobacteriia bacterium]
MPLTEGLRSIIFGVATSLLYPVLLFEVVALVYVAYESGRFSLECFRRARARRTLDIDALVPAAAAGGAALIEALSEFGPTVVPTKVRHSLGDGEGLTQGRLVKALADGEFEAARILERTRMLVRLGPVLGLMGTLIPISPALVGLAQGDVLTLSNNLVIAFSTTVVGLLIGGIAYIVTTVRERQYRSDISDIEFLLGEVTT